MPLVVVLLKNKRRIDYETEPNYRCYSRNAVSYTHLDVYKRQNKSFWEGHKTITFDTLTDRHQYEVIAVFKTVVYTDSSDSFKSVSYTHLDVYKRQ